MRNKRWFAKCAMLCACMLMTNTSLAEEKRLGDYIYVPAMQLAPVTGSVSLRVEGLALGEEDAAQVVESLAGAEFGVYVFSGSGDLTPWANPLYPSEPMRIRTGSGETRFTLPQGAEYYLRQESAPQGYLFDDETLIPVTGEEIVVRNAMAGQLHVRAVDSLGVPVQGVELEVVGDDGETVSLVTDENGEAVLVCDQAQGYTVAQRGLPEGVFAARAVTGGEATQDGVYATVSAAHRTRVTFEHPASGSVLLDVQLMEIDDNAQRTTRPLEGVEMDILSDPPMRILTDSQGQARASVLEGTYQVALRYAGKEQALLPISEGQMIVESGATTVIELEATQAMGRIVVSALCEKEIAGGSVTLTSEETGKAYGPYALDAEGVAISEALAAGGYRVSAMEVEQDVQLGGISSGEASAQRLGELLLTVEPGQVTQAEIALLTRESQMFGLISEGLDERGETQQTAIGDALTFTLMSEHGEEIAEVKSMLGIASIEALSGRYTLRMADKDARKLGVQPVSRPFDLPSAQETIVFDAELTRVVLASVDENGAPVAGAVYQLTDSTGARFEAACDEDGLAVSALLAPGEVTVETLDAPQGYAASGEVKAEAFSGEAALVSIAHARFGSVNLSVRMQHVDERGNVAYKPLAGAQVTLVRIAQDGTPVDLGVNLTADESGTAAMSLEAGAYAAVIEEQTLEMGCRAPEMARFEIANTQDTQVELVCLGAKGGVRAVLTGGTLSDDELAQVRFELTDADGTKMDMTLLDGAHYVGGLAAGEYVLRQTQMPQGYTLAPARSVQIWGGEISEVSVPLEEYAVVSVSKTGLTFDSQLRTYIVPLSGEYGVFTMEDGEMKPYPSREAQAVLWANVTMEEIAQGKAGSAKLPAKIDGTTYYLHELSAAPGFAADETYYEVQLRAGERTTLETAVSSDRGFFMLDAVDAATGAHVPGGSYALLDAASGETVMTFDMGEAPYQNPMAVPVGQYVLRQQTAAPGYALGVPAQTPVRVEPYLTAGGTVTDVRMEAVRVPTGDQMDLIQGIYAAQQQGLTLLSVETGALSAGERLLAPSLTIFVGAVGSERSDIASVVIAGSGDAQGNAYRARVEYCLEGGGWQPSDARMTEELVGPTAVSLDDVTDDISAVRITYLDALTGEEAVQGGFTPGQVTLSVEASAQGDVNMKAEAAFDGVFVYQTELGGRQHALARRAQMAQEFTMQTDGLFRTVSPGRDGRISGVAFFDEDADGVMDAQETGRYAGLTVTLQTLAGDVVDTVRTDANGRYAFDTISAGEYRIRFDAGESVVFSSGSLYSAHAISGVQDMRYGASDTIVIDGGHTDYLVHVGCIFASEISGHVLERIEGGERVGFAGLNVEMRAVNADEDEEPLVVITGGMGDFRFSRILPGEYEISIGIEPGYLCDAAEDGVITRRVTLGAGDSVSFGEIELEKEASVRGSVRVDDDGDGVIAEGAQALSGVRVALLRADDAHTQKIAETTTDASGAYAFEHLPSGAYSVLFELGGQWAFTRYGEDSSVYGAVSQSGASRSFMLEPGMDKRDIHAGVTIPAQLRVSVFSDTLQYDGRKGVYEELLPGVELSLIRLENGKDAEEIAYTTDASGSVVFAGVSPGEYVIAYRMPEKWRSTKQVDPGTSNYPVSCVPQSAERTGRSLPFTLMMGEEEKHLYIGAMLSGSIGGVVYFDDDADANRDETEAGCANAQVELLGGNGDVLAVTASQADGSYLFEGLAPGRYSVRFTAQEGCGFSGTERTMTRGGVQASDMHVSATRSIALDGGQALTTAHAGVVRLGSITGMLWEDQDGDRTPGAQEHMMDGVSVHLMDGAGRNILASCETDVNGQFRFERLKPGTYKLRMDAPEGYVFSGAQAGSALALEAERDGRGYTQAFTLLGGVHVDALNFGLLTQGVISGLVWDDVDFDGEMDGEEAGLRGVTIALLDENGQEMAVRHTVRSGEFAFDQLMPGAYALRVTLEGDYEFTAEGGQSLAPHGGDKTAVIPLGTLDMGGSIADVRIGALRAASVGGVVWMDQDDDGRRADRDQGMPGVQVTLQLTDGADAGRTYETQTDENGMYRFDCVMPGSAVLTFALEPGYAFARNASGTRRVSSVAKADALSASTDTIRIAAGGSLMDIDVGVVGVGTISGRIWEDARYDGRMADDERGVSGAVVELVDRLTGNAHKSVQSGDDGAYSIDFVRKGEYVLRVTLPDGRIFTRAGDSAIADIDSASAQTEPLAIDMGEHIDDVCFGAIAPARIGGYVLIDGNENGICDADETGLEGAVVTAMQGGTVVATERADAAGAFSFDMLRPGTYRLRYVLDEATLFAHGAPLKLTDADAMDGETGEYTLAMGEAVSVPAVPVVLASRISGRAFLDEDVNGAMDAGEAALSGVLAELLDAQGRVLDSDSVSAEGAYAFERLRSGDYAVRFTLPQGVLFTDYTGREGDSCVPVVEGEAGTSETIHLSMGEKKDAMHVGGILPGRIGDTVWHDKNGNGLQDYKEPLLPGVSLTLLVVQADGAMTEIATTLSDEYGYYAFESLRPGSYVLRANLQEGDTLTSCFGAPMGEIDSDVDPDTGMSAPILLRSGQTLRNIDVGFTDHAQ